MARRIYRRRRKQVEWVRTAITANSGGVGGDKGPLASGSLTCDGSVAQNVAVQNIIIGDQPYVSDSLIEERKTYVVDRLVGRLTAASVGWKSGVGVYFPAPIFVKWGVFVGETDEAGNIQDLDRYDLFSHGGQEADWMMQDGFILGGNLSPASLPNQSPVNTYGWLMDGTNQTRAPWGMIDVRSRRRVGQMERLWFMIAAECMDSTWDYTGHPTQLVYNVDLRALIHWTAGTNKR